VWTGGKVCLGPTTGWGLEFLVTFGLACGIYLGGGSAWGARVSGGAVGVRAHPHWRQWHELHALVRDGVGFAKGRKGAREEKLYVDTTGGEQSPKGKGSKKEKKAKRTKGSGRRGATQESAGEASAAAAAVGLPAVAAAAAATAAPATSVASGGGGRWVHVPT